MIKLENHHFAVPNCGGGGDSSKGPLRMIKVLKYFHSVKVSLQKIAVKWKNENVFIMEESGGYLLNQMISWAWVIMG